MTFCGRSYREPYFPFRHPVVGLDEKPIHDISFRAVSFESLPADGKLFTLQNTERISFRQVACSEVLNRQ